MRKLKNKLGFKLFYNDKFVMVFSIFVAFISWLYVSSTTQESSVFTVTNIPVTLPELTGDLRYFNADGLTAEVKISGNALVVASVTSEDILITAADISKITAPGTYDIELVPKKSSIKTDYSFTSTVTPSSVEVFVDQYIEREIPITDKIVVKSVDEGCYASQTVLSQQTVKVTGAKSVVDSIEQAVAEYTFQSTLSDTTVVKAPIVLYDSLDKEVKSSYIKMDISEVDATVPILGVHNLRIEPRIVNMPEGLKFDSSRIKVEPAAISVALPSSASLTSLFTESIDFSQVSLERTSFTVKIETPVGCKNIDGTETAEVTFDLSDMTTKTLAVTKFGVINMGSEQKAAVSTKSVNLTIVGPKSKLATITANDITAVVDLSEKSSLQKGIVEMPLSIAFSDKYSDCWVQGDYTVNVSFSSKTTLIDPLISSP